MPLNRALFGEIAQFAVDGTAFDKLPVEVVELSKEIIVNAGAVGLAGAAQEEGHIITRFVQEMGGNGRCTIIGKGLRTSPVYAALTNGVLIRLLDFDDELSTTGAHPGSAIFPVVMALGEMNGINGREVVSAFAAGCEISTKVTTWLRQESGMDSGSGEASLDCRGVAASLGAAAAAGRLLGLDAQGIEQALLLAPARADPARSVSGAGPIHAYVQGRASMNGIMAAMLTSQGISAVPAPVPSATAGGFSDEGEAAGREFGASLGNPFDMVNPGIALKIYPCASATHTAIDAALQLIQQYRISTDQMASVEVGVTPAALREAPFPTPTNGWEARSCLSFIVASALTYGHPLIDNFTDSAVADTAVRGLMDRISVVASETPHGSIAYPASVAITLKDGRRLSHRAEFARGQAGLPLSPEELDAKFLYCSRYILPPDHIEESVTRLRDLENIENTTGIFSVLGG